MKQWGEKMDFYLAGDIKYNHFFSFLKFSLRPISGRLVEPQVACDPRLHGALMHLDCRMNRPLWRGSVQAANRQCASLFKSQSLRTHTRFVLDWTSHRTWSHANLQPSCDWL